jgi:hypothetical protein
MPGLDEKKLREVWAGELGQEMAQLVTALKTALPSATVEHLGERATMRYGPGGTLSLVFEDGVWKIEEF